jgi:hypothetical protein
MECYLKEMIKNDAFMTTFESLPVDEEFWHIAGIQWLNVHIGRVVWISRHSADEDLFKTTIENHSKTCPDNHNHIVNFMVLVQTLTYDFLHKELSPENYSRIAMEYIINRIDEPFPKDYQTKNDNSDILKSIKAFDHSVELT